MALTYYRTVHFQKIISSMQSPQEITSILEERLQHAMLSNGRVLLGGFHNIIRHNLRFLPVQAGAKIVSTIAILNVLPRSPKRDTCTPHILLDGRLIVRAALQFLLPVS